MKKIKRKKSKFLRLRNYLEKDLTDKSKNYTGSDLFDWLLLLVLFGGGTALICFFFYENKIEAGDAFIGFILWFTAFALFRYTKETYWLKEVTRKQLEEYRNNNKNNRKMRTLDIISEHNKYYRFDILDVMTNMKKMDAILAFFEKCGLMLREELIDFRIFYGSFSIIFPDYYNNEEIKKTVENIRLKWPKAFDELLYMKDRFETEKNKHNHG